jgi:hypothetical protein
MHATIGRYGGVDQARTGSRGCSRGDELGFSRAKGRGSCLVL